MTEDTLYNTVAGPKGEDKLHKETNVGKGRLSVRQNQESHLHYSFTIYIFYLCFNVFSQKVAAVCPLA